MMVRNAGGIGLIYPDIAAIPDVNHVLVAHGERDNRLASDFDRSPYSSGDSGIPINVVGCKPRVLVMRFGYVEHFDLGRSCNAGQEECGEEDDSAQSIAHRDLRDQTGWRA